MKSQTDYLKKFIKTECANYDKHYGGCLLCWRGCNVSDEVHLACLDFEPYTFCKVDAGERCPFLEGAVLGPLDYKFRLPDYDYQKLFAQYAEQTNTKTQAVSGSAS